LAGLAVEHVVLTGLGIKIVQLVTDDPDAARCPSGRVLSSSGKDWVLTRPRDLPCGGEHVRTGGRLLGAAAGIALIATGVVLLSRSSLLQRLQLHPS
jgi:hypothetical protein